MVFLFTSSLIEIGRVCMAPLLLKLVVTPPLYVNVFVSFFFFHFLLFLVSGAGKTCGDGSTGPLRSTVFINDTAFEVAEGPISVREAFGEEAVLLHSSGQPVLTNEWGVTMHPLQHGAFYYLVNLNV